MLIFCARSVPLLVCTIGYLHVIDSADRASSKSLSSAWLTALQLMQLQNSMGCRKKFRGGSAATFVAHRTFNHLFSASLLIRQILQKSKTLRQDHYDFLLTGNSRCLHHSEVEAAATVVDEEALVLVEEGAEEEEVRYND